MRACQVEGGQTSTGSAVAWLRRLVGEVGYDALGAEAAAVPPGSDGLVCLDHFQVGLGATQRLRVLCKQQLW